MGNKYKIIVHEDNKEQILGEKESIENLEIITRDSCENNVIHIFKPAVFAKGCRFELRGKNTEIILNSNHFVYNFHLITSTNSSNQMLYFGKNCSMWYGINININDDNASVHIGDDCMLSKNIDIYGSDGHTIYDKDSYLVLNSNKEETYIGNRVWIGADVIITKGSQILDDSVIGAGSIVTKRFEQTNVVVAGNPAAIIKENICWSRKQPSKFDMKTTERPVTPKIAAVIPARYNSSRFPGKPLADILGKPMIQWVYERVSNIPDIFTAYVATDDKRIFDAVESFGGKAVMTGECSCGSDRVYEACKDISADIILNIQGDEPLIRPEMIRELIKGFRDSKVQMATLKKEIVSDSELNNPNITKIVTDIENNAIYFSRSAIPWNRDNKDTIKYYKHIGVYGYTYDFLKTFVKLPHSVLEDAEQLEQLRAIEHGYKIRVIETQYQSIGVDLPEHISHVEAELKSLSERAD